MDIKNNLRSKLTEASGRVLYCALVLPEESRKILMNNFEAPNGWVIYADHIRI